MPKALAVNGNDSQHYKELRNKVQRACMECRKKFYSKVASLKESNTSRWWREVPVRALLVKELKQLG